MAGKPTNTRQNQSKRESSTFQELDILARRVFTIEVQNPGQPVSKIIEQLRETGWEGDKDTIYRLRKRPEYQEAILDHQKSAMELWEEMQGMAAVQLKRSLKSRNEKIRHDAAKFVASHTKDMAMKKAEFEFQLAMEDKKRSDPPKTQVEVVMAGGIPIIGKSQINEKGEISQKSLPEPENKPDVNEAPPKSTENDQSVNSETQDDKKSAQGAQLSEKSEPPEQSDDADESNGGFISDLPE